MTKQVRRLCFLSYIYRWPISRMVTELFFLFSLLHLVITTSTAKSLELPVFNNYLLLFYPVAMGLWESSSEDASTYTDLLTFAFRGPSHTTTTGLSSLMPKTRRGR